MAIYLIALQIARHFTSLDPKLKINLTADYTMDSHAKDHQQQFTSSSGIKQKRAKALLDFERSDNDELGFKKNDIINVVSQKDEHCWVSLINSYTLDDYIEIYHMDLYSYL